MAAAITKKEPQVQQEEGEQPLFTNSYDLFNVILDNVNTLQNSCNRIKTLRDVMLFWDKSEWDLMKISSELRLLRLLLQKGR